jgi:hypothetical protein
MPFYGNAYATKLSQQTSDSFELRVAVRRQRRINFASLTDR